MANHKNGAGRLRLVVDNTKPARRHRRTRRAYDDTGWPSGTAQAPGTPIGSAQRNDLTPAHRQPPITAAHDAARGKLLDIRGIRVAESTGLVLARNGDNGALDLCDSSDLRLSKLDESHNGRVGQTSFPGDPSQGDVPFPDPKAQAIGDVSNGLHEANHNVRFIARSSVRLTGRAEIRTAPHNAPMSRPFSHVVLDLKDAIGSYERMEAYFGGNPVKSTWGDWGRGKREAPGGRLAKTIAATLGCTVAQLHGEEPWPSDFLARLRADARTKLGQPSRIAAHDKEARQMEILERAIKQVDQLSTVLRELLGTIKAETQDTDRIAG